jgi:hypothetical protein
MMWDDYEILRAVDALQEQNSGAPVWSRNGLQLMEEIAGEPISDEREHRGFLQELLIAQKAGLLEFRLDRWPGSRTPDPDQVHWYLQSIRNFALTVSGQDRARGRVIVTPLPDPAEDDGRSIGKTVMRTLVDELSDEYEQGELRDFFLDSGLPLDGPLLRDIVRGSAKSCGRGDLGGLRHADVL